MTRSKKIIGLTLAAIAIAVAGLLFARMRHPSGASTEDHAEAGEHREEEEGAAKTVRLSEEALEAAHLEIVRVARGRLSRDIVLVGELVVPPDRMAMVGPRTAARVSRVNVNVGDRVERGATLATVDSSDYGRARGAYITAAARVEQAQATYQRQELLRQDRISSAADFEAARANLAAARADLEAARGALVALGLSAPGATESAGSTVTLRSPIAGVVVARQAIVGQNVDAAATLFTVADLGELWVELTAYERDLGRVATGQEVSITLGALPGRELRGRVTHVGELLDDRTRSARVRVVVDERLAHRRRILAAAFDAHPERFPRGRPTPLAPPAKVWINPPRADITTVPAAGTRWRRSKPAWGAASAGPEPTRSARAETPGWDSPSP